MRKVIMREIIGISAGLAPMLLMVVAVVLIGLAFDTIGGISSPIVPIP